MEKKRKKAIGMIGEEAARIGKWPDLDAILDISGLDLEELNTLFPGGFPEIRNLILTEWTDRAAARVTFIPKPGLSPYDRLHSFAKAAFNRMSSMGLSKARLTAEAMAPENRPGIGLRERMAMQRKVVDDIIASADGPDKASCSDGEAILADIAATCLAGMTDGAWDPHAAAKSLAARYFVPPVAG